MSRSRPAHDAMHSSSDAYSSEDDDPFESVEKELKVKATRKPVQDSSDRTGPDNIQSSRVRQTQWNGENIHSTTMNAAIKSPVRSTRSSPSSTSTTRISTRTDSAVAPQMKSLLSFLDEHEQTIERDQEMLEKLSRTSQERSTPLSPRSNLISPRSVSSHSGRFELAFASAVIPAPSQSGSSTPATTVVQTDRMVTTSGRSVPRGHSASASRSKELSRTPSQVSLVSSRAPSELSIPSTTIPTTSHHTSSFTDIKHKMQTLKNALSEKDAQLASLERQLRDTKAHGAASLASQASTFELQLTQQRSEYESTLLRHQSFIEQLMGNKEELNSKVEALTAEISSLEQAYKRKLDAFEQESEIRFQQRMEVLLTSEKIKRDQFVAQKTKSIKALTIKGLEPEIDRLMSQSKKDLLQAQESFAIQLRQRETELARDHEQQLQQLRSTMLHERDQAVEQERSYGQEKIQSQIDSADALLSEQRARFHAELEEQRRTLTADSESKEKGRGHAAVSAAEQRVRSMKEHHMQDLLLERQRFESQLSLMKTQNAEEKIRVERSFQETIGEQMRTREKELRQILQKESAEEVELVLEKLSQEHSTQIAQVESDHRRQMDRLTQRMKELEEQLLSAQNDRAQQEHQQRSEITTLSTSLAMEQSRNSSLQRQLKDLEVQLNSTNHKLHQYESSQSSLREEMDARYAQQLKDLQLERDAAKTAWREERDRGMDASKRADKQLSERLQFQEAKHAAEVESVQLRVKHMVEKKELVISQLRAELETKEKKMREIERMMEG